MKKKWLVVLVLLFVVVGAAAFPIYCFGGQRSHGSVGLLVCLNLVCYWELGLFEKSIWKVRTLSRAAGINVGIVAAGMLCRYLLEWGEISNTYNFTWPNMLLHFVAAVFVSTLSYWMMNRKG